MKSISWKKKIRLMFLAFLTLAAFAAIPAAARKVQAATPGFKTVNGKTYYINADGKRQRGWLTLNGRKYYFDKKTGVQLKGWQVNSKGERIRYFTSGKGVMVTGFLTDKSGNTRYFSPKTGKMVTGWMKDSEGHRYYFKKGSGIMLKGWATSSGKKRYFSKTTGIMSEGWLTSTGGNTRYFSPKTGYMYTGLKKIGGKYYYFSKKSGVRYQKGFGTVSGKKYYFDPSDGHAHTGWLTLDGKRYYFNAKGVMYAGTTAVIDGVTYRFTSAGVAKEKSTASDTSDSSGLTVTVYDEKNGRNYTVMKEYTTHPGVQSGETSDLDLLAAFCESEAGNQGLAGMKAVALSLLNRTIRPDGEFPSTVRLVLYHGTTFPQYSVVTNGVLEKRLNGEFDNRTKAYKAAQLAINTFNEYVTNGTKRKVSGIKTDDFDYMYFMTENAFWSQPLNFEKVDYIKYKDHVFFVDWVS